MLKVTHPERIKLCNYFCRALESQVLRLSKLHNIWKILGKHFRFKIRPWSVFFFLLQNSKRDEDRR